MRVKKNAMDETIALLRDFSGDDCVAIPPHRAEAIVEEIDRLHRIEKAALTFVKDLQRRYPGQDFTCPFVRALDAALKGTSED